MCTERDHDPTVEPKLTLVPIAFLAYSCRFSKRLSRATGIPHDKVIKGNLCIHVTMRVPCLVLNNSSSDDLQTGRSSKFPRNSGTHGDPGT